ncbi:glycoside hydrolase family 88 protein [Paenibacillus sp. FSL R7-0345]|uniref:glycoside hydrolase family 88 protein n=1 Tax=Paenibacillus sp. FSL R7-0345 TaxID=2954535 RepID=UPI003159BBE4
MSKEFADAVLKRLEPKVDRMLEQIGDKCPHVAREDGIYDNTGSDWWTSGFWPGLLWVMYSVTGKERYKEAAWRWDEEIEQWFVKTNEELHHDVGFQFLMTAVIKHTLTGDKDGLRRGLEAANFLAGRFNPAGGFIRAWNMDKYGWAIIDCMMNISLLYWASRVSGDPRFKHIASIHADTALQHFIRQDGSVNHIVSFDPESGEFLESFGGQGYGPHSAWSRGQAWAIYGMANTYRNTGEIRYLEAAKRVAHYYIASLPEDSVPYWDFRAEQRDGQEEPRDSSAAAIAASGLLEIAKLVPAVEAELYYNKAYRILQSLTEHYGTWDQPNHEAILIKGTGHKPANSNIHVSLIYGDYFYVEAIAKISGWQQCIF